MQIKQRFRLIFLDTIGREEAFGVLAAGIRRVALPLPRRFTLPTAKRIGKELLKQSFPGILDVASNKKSPKQAVKSTLSKTVKMQTRGSRKHSSPRQKRRSEPRKTKYQQQLQNVRVSF